MLYSVSSQKALSVLVLEFVHTVQCVFAVFVFFLAWGAPQDASAAFERQLMLVRFSFGAFE